MLFAQEIIQPLEQSRQIQTLVPKIWHILSMLQIVAGAKRIFIAIDNGLSVSKKFYHQPLTIWQNRMFFHLEHAPRPITDYLIVCSASG